jgi:hypothetical protein
MEDSQNEYVGLKGVLILHGGRFPKKDAIWANSYTVKRYGRDKALELYEKLCVKNWQVIRNCSN